MTEYYIHLRNLKTGKEAKIRRYLTADQVKQSVIGRVDKHNVQLVDFFPIATVPGLFYNRTIKL